MNQQVISDIRHYDQRVTAAPTNLGNDVSSSFTYSGNQEIKRFMLIITLAANGGHLRRRGSKMSRAASPTRLNPNDARSMANPGAVTIQGYVNT
jgi:hypothetical protein